MELRIESRSASRVLDDLQLAGDDIIEESRISIRLIDRGHKSIHIAGAAVHI